MCPVLARLLDSDMTHVWLSAPWRTTGYTGTPLLPDSATDSQRQPDTVYMPPCNNQHVAVTAVFPSHMHALPSAASHLLSPSNLHVCHSRVELSWLRHQVHQARRRCRHHLCNPCHGINIIYDRCEHAHSLGPQRCQLLLVLCVGIVWASWAPTTALAATTALDAMLAAASARSAAVCASAASSCCADVAKVSSMSLLCSACMLRSSILGICPVRDWYGDPC